MNCVTFDEAQAFCAAQAKRMPTEKEWEYTARGRDGRSLPWGDDDAAGKACFARAAEGTCAAGAFPSGQSPFGALDMAGNVAEWTSTSEDGQRFIRGGDYADKSASGLRSNLRAGRRRDQQSDKTVGFRCVR